MKRLVVIIIVFAVCAYGCAVLGVQSASVSPELKQRGKELRKAIDEEYKRLADADELKSEMGGGRDFITDVVIKYIPIGTSFNDAEAILRTAGFEVGIRNMNPILTNHYGVYSKIEYYKQLIPTFCKRGVGVFLESKSKDDWSTVQRLEAAINVICL
jgi:hypothetical protein